MGQKWPFFNFFFLGSIGQENVFYDILERRKAFLRYKNKKFKSRKIDIFPKWLTHSFGPKMASFETFFLGNIGQENVFYDILGRKNAFLGYKNKKVKIRKIDILPRGLIHGFSPKIAIFPTYFLGNIGQENVFTIF